MEVGFVLGGLQGRGRSVDWFCEEAAYDMYFR